MSPFLKYFWQLFAKEKVVLVLVYDSKMGINVQYNKELKNIFNSNNGNNNILT